MPKCGGARTQLVFAMKVLLDYDYAMPIPMIDECAKRFEKMIRTCKMVCPGIRLDDEEQFLTLLKSESRMTEIKDA